MKKLAAVLLSTAIILTLTACKKSDNSDKSDEREIDSLPPVGVVSVADEPKVTSSNNAGNAKINLPVGTVSIGFEKNPYIFMPMVSSQLPGVKLIVSTSAEYSSFVYETSRGSFFTYKGSKITPQGKAVNNSDCVYWEPSIYCLGNNEDFGDVVITVNAVDENDNIVAAGSVKVIKTSSDYYSATFEIEEN